MYFFEVADSCIVYHMPSSRRMSVVTASVNGITHTHGEQSNFDYVFTVLQVSQL